MQVVEVWRGLSVTDDVASKLSNLSVGTKLSTKQHPWWTVKRGIAEAYATTGKGKPLLIKATLETSKEYLTPCFPRLESFEILTLEKVILYTP